LRLALLGVTVLAGRESVLVEIFTGAEDRLTELTVDSVLGADVTCHCKTVMRF